MEKASPHGHEVQPRSAAQGVEESFCKKKREQEVVLLFCSCSEEELVASTADGGLACKTREELLFLFFRCFAFLLSERSE